MNDISLNDDQIKELFYRVLRDMILDIRSDSYVSGDRKNYYRADLIHNIPSILRYDPDSSDSDKLRTCLEWFSLHMKDGSRFKEYLESQVEIVLNNVPS